LKQIIFPDEDILDLFGSYRQLGWQCLQIGNTKYKFVYFKDEIKHISNNYDAFDVGLNNYSKMKIQDAIERFIDFSLDFLFVLNF
jgi:hypothetical protein